MCLSILRGEDLHLDGRIHPDFAEVERVLRQQIGNYPGGGAVCVYHRGECVVDLWGGYKDAEGTLWERDTMAPSFSTTKGVAATLLHIYADRGLIDYDAPVAEYWPEFAKAGKAKILRSVAYPRVLDVYKFCSDELKKSLDCGRELEAKIRAEEDRIRLEGKKAEAEASDKMLEQKDEKEEQKANK